MKLSKLKTLTLASILAAVSTTVFAENIPVRVASSLSVDMAVSRLTTAIEKVGAKVFITINYAEGVASVGETIRPTTLVIFGSPKIGGSVFKAGQTMGLYLPLRILAYQDEANKTWLMYNDPAGAAEEHGIAKNHPAVLNMQKILSKITDIAAGN